MKPKAPTLADVARQAGVATPTASKALSGAPYVRAETRAKVLAAAEFLGYRPNTQARALQSGRTYTVGLLTSDAQGRFTMPLMLGVEHSLATGRMGILFCDARADPIRELHWVQTLLSRNMDGVIVTAHRSDPRTSISHLLNVPVVYAYSPSEDESDVSVAPNDRQGGRLAGEHLTELGRQKLAYVGGPKSYVASFQRRDGFVEALHEKGLDLAVPELFIPWEEKAGRRAARTLLQRETPLDAVFCASDQIARGVSEELQAHGVKVPDDVAIVGFDDWGVMTLATEPTLTSLSMNLDRVGEIAATRLLELIGGAPVASGVEYVDCELLVRGSSV